MAQHSFTRTENFSSHGRPAPAASSTRTRTQSSAGTRNPRGLTRPAQDSSGTFVLLDF